MGLKISPHKRGAERLPTLRKRTRPIGAPQSSFFDMTSRGSRGEASKFAYEGSRSRTGDFAGEASTAAR